jgi:hypothetical protein
MSSAKFPKCRELLGFPLPLSRKVNECGQANQAVTTEGEMIFGSYCSFDIGAPNTSI